MAGAIRRRLAVGRRVEVTFAPQFLRRLREVAAVVKAGVGTELVVDLGRLEGFGVAAEDIEIVAAMPRRGGASPALTRPGPFLLAVRGLCPFLLPAVRLKHL